MGHHVEWCVVVVTVALCQAAVACNVRELSEIIQNRFRQEVAANCGVLGDKCTFDRECCKNLECKMSASKAGVDNYCQKRVLTEVQKADIPLSESGESVPANEPQSSEDGNWMAVKSEDTEEEKDVRNEDEDVGEKKKPTDTLSEIERLQETKRVQLLKQNEELEKLFTEREDKELKQLRALKEDAEMDELRRLRELRLKRKLQLLKELRELRGLKAEDDLDMMNELKNKTNSNEEEEAKSTTIQAEMQQKTTTYNDSSTLREDTEQTTQLEETVGEPQTAVQQYPQQPDQPQAPELTTLKHKQGTHEMHHRRKHHQQRHKRKEPQGSNGNSTTANKKANTHKVETETKENIVGNKTQNTTT